jgi:hypothetical protein
MAAQDFLRNLKNEMLAAENDGVAAKVFVSSLNITTVPRFILRPYTDSQKVCLFELMKLKSCK